MIHFFNPGHESAVLNNSPFYMMPANVTLMQRELSFLPAWYASKSDMVLVDNNFDFEFYKSLSSEFKNLPTPIIEAQLINYADSCIDVWGISPQVVHHFENLNNKYGLVLQIPKWENEFRQLTSREMARTCMAYLKEHISDINVELPIFFDNIDAAENYIQQTNKALLAKSPYSSSGRGLLWIRENDYNRATQQILRGMFNKQAVVSIEKALTKHLDFAMEFRCENSDVNFVGYSLFETNKKGAYEGNILTSQQEIEEKIGSFISLQLLHAVKVHLTEFLKKNYSRYNGCLGIDMLIYFEDGKYRIYPCVEINMRSNMGLLAINLVERYVSPQKEGRFVIDFSKKEGEINDRHTELLNANAPRFEAGKLYSGYLPLCPVNTNSHYWAYIKID